jgi:hypothetical protein
MKSEGYLGNNNLKKSNVLIQWTQDNVQEYLKCAKDPIYFAENYIKIVHVDRGLISMKMYNYQKSIVDLITNNRRVAVLTSRQAGKTTTAVAVILHYVLFNEHKTVALLANKGDAAREILERIKIAYEALPKWMQQGVKEWNKGNIELENGCKVFAGSTTSSAIRGKSISFLYMDEVAFIEGYDEFFASVYPTISSGQETKVLMTSTPNGLNHFYKTCEGAKEGHNGYKYLEVMWYDVPGRDENWKRETLEALDFDMEKFAQEYECAFLGSSGTLIEGSKLKALVFKQPIIDRNGLTVYEEPKEGHTYICIVDVSRGKGLDYSAFQLIDVTKMPYKQVATFRDNTIGPADYAGIIHQITKKYHEPYVLVEINDIGEQVAEILAFDFEVEGILFTENAGRGGKRISGGYGKNVDKGVRTTKSVKAIGCNMLKMLIEQDQLIIRDFNTINELSTFSRRGNSYEAESGCHDDLVMGLVLFSWLTDQAFFKDITNINTMMTLKRKNEEDLFADVMPDMIIDDGLGDDMKKEDDNPWMVDYSLRNF